MFYVLSRREYLQHFGQNVHCTVVYSICISNIFYHMKTEEPLHHKVCIYLEYHSVCPLVGIATPPPRVSVYPLPRTKRGEMHSPAGA